MMIRISDGFRVLEIRVIAGFAGTGNTRYPISLPAGITRKFRVLPEISGFNRKMRVLPEIFGYFRAGARKRRVLPEIFKYFCAGARKRRVLLVIFGYYQLILSCVFSGNSW